MMNLKVPFQDRVTDFVFPEGCSPHGDVAAGVVISRQPLPGKEVPHSLCLLLGVRNSKELEVSWQN